MLTFIQKYGGMTKLAALKFGADRLGVRLEIRDEIYSKNAEKNTIKMREREAAVYKEEQALSKSKQAFAKNLAAQSIPAEKTLVDKYLTEYRKVGLEKYPQDIRFHPGVYSKLNDKTLPAMLVIARNKNGVIQAVQATYLDPKTGNKADKENVKIQKQTFGTIKGATLHIQGKNNDTVLIAEGTETGLSLAKAVPGKSIQVTLGKSNFLNIETKSDVKNVIFCLDNDGKKLIEDKVIESAVMKQVADGKTVKVMLPTALLQDKQDYNDVIKLKGVAAIQKDYREAFLANEIYKIPSSVELNTPKTTPVSTKKTGEQTTHDIEKRLRYHAIEGLF